MYPGPIVIATLKIPSLFEGEQDGGIDVRSKEPLSLRRKKISKEA